MFDQILTKQNKTDPNGREKNSEEGEEESGKKWHLKNKYIAGKHKKTHSESERVEINENSFSRASLMWKHFDGLEERKKKETEADKYKNAYEQSQVYWAK